MTGGNVGNFIKTLFGNDDESVDNGYNAVDMFGEYISQWNEALNESEREFQTQSAREAMAFSAQQAELDRIFQQKSAREAMQFEADQAALNRNYQTEMSNTAYQRAVKDMQAAGINPILAYTQGGASTPTGASASGVAASGSSARGVSRGKGNATDIVQALTTMLGNSSRFITDLIKGIGSIVPF